MGKGPSHQIKAIESPTLHCRAQRISSLKMASDREHRAFSPFSTEIVSADNFVSVPEETWDNPSVYEIVDDREFYLQNCALELRRRFVFIFT